MSISWLSSFCFLASCLNILSDYLQININCMFQNENFYFDILIPSTPIYAHAHYHFATQAVLQPEIHNPKPDRTGPNRTEFQTEPNSKPNSTKPK